MVIISILLGNPLSRLSLTDLALPEGLEPEDEYHTGLEAHDWTGMLVHSGQQGRIAKLQLYMTAPEDREFQANGLGGIVQAFIDNTDLGDLVFNHRDPELENTNMATWLCKLGIPLEPESPAEAVHQYLDQQATSLAWVKPHEVTSKSGGTASFQRAVSILPQGLVIEAVLRDHKLYEWRMLDLEACVLSDPMEHYPKARRQPEKEQLLANIHAGDLPTLLRYSIVRDQELVWQRNFDLPTEESSTENEEESFTDEDEVMQALGERVPLSRDTKKPKRWLSRLRLRNADADDDDSERFGHLMFRQQWMKKKYGSLTSLLEQTPQDHILYLSAVWFLYPEKKNDIRGRQLGRMAFLLHWFHSEIRDSGGLSGWLGYHWLPSEDDAEEASEALRTIGAGDFVGLLSQLSQKARNAGCDPRKASGWDRFFETHACEDEEKRAYELASSLPNLFHQYVRLHPELVVQGEASVEEITKERPLEFIDQQDHLASTMQSMGGLQKDVEKLMDASLKDLAAIDGMEDSCTQLEECLDQMSESLLDLPSNDVQDERSAILSEFHNLTGVVARAPEEELLAIIADVGGYDEDEPNKQLPPAVRMAGMLDIWLDDIEGGLDDWFDQSEPDDVKDIHMILQILQSPLAEHVQSAYEAGLQAAALQDEEFAWYEFAEDHPNHFPDPDTLERESMRLPALYRSHWIQRPVGDFDEEPVLAS